MGSCRLHDNDCFTYYGWPEMISKVLEKMGAYASFSQLENRHRWLVTQISLTVTNESGPRLALCRNEANKMMTYIVQSFRQTDNVVIKLRSPSSFSFDSTNVT